MAAKAGRQWTPEQIDAIQAGQTNLLVAAAAGAGKTAVLVERIIRRLTDAEAPVSLENLLVVTFTDAAAAEMRQRIGAALEQAVARRPENEAWRRQLLLLNRAAISTIHAFCLRVLRTYFYRLDLDPAFRVMDPAEADLMQLEVIDRVLEEAFAAEPDGGPVTDLADGLGGRGDAALVDLVLKVWNFTRSLPWPEQWLDAAVAAYTMAAPTPLPAFPTGRRPDAAVAAYTVAPAAAGSREPAGGSGNPGAAAGCGSGGHDQPVTSSDAPAPAFLAARPWYRELQQSIALSLEEAAFYLQQARTLAAGPGGPAVYLDHLEREAGAVRELLAAMGDLSWEEFWQRLAGIDFARLPAVRRESADPELKERVTGYRDQAKKLLRNLQQEGYRDGEAIKDELARAGAAAQALVGLVRRFAAAYNQEKHRRSLLDFSDLEHLCLQVLLDPAAPPGELRPSEVALELRRRYAEVLVDEYQDINSIQDAILTLVSRQGVGVPATGPGQVDGAGTCFRGEQASGDRGVLSGAVVGEGANQPGCPVSGDTGPCLYSSRDAQQPGFSVPSGDGFKRLSIAGEFPDQLLIRAGEPAPPSLTPAAAPNLFMVGDVKQSIYRFRLANPELFLEKYRTYPAYREEPAVGAIPPHITEAEKWPAENAGLMIGAEGSTTLVSGAHDREDICHGGLAGAAARAAVPCRQVANTAAPVPIAGNAEVAIPGSQILLPGNQALLPDDQEPYPGSPAHGRRILLKANFRSRQGVVDGVNFIFRQVFLRLVGELEYDADAALVGRADYPDNPAAVPPAVEVYLLERKIEADPTTAAAGQGLPRPGFEAGAAGDSQTSEAAKDAVSHIPATGAAGATTPAATLPGQHDAFFRAMGQGDAGSETGEGGATPAGGPAAPDLEELTALEREALLVARRIRRMVQGDPERPGAEFQVWDTEKKAYREITWRDIVILLRATKDRAPVFLEALQQQGIPAYADLGGGYFAAIEVETILSLLRVIDNPRQDIPLAAVLRSPLVGLTADELARVRLAAPGEDFYTAVVRAAKPAGPVVQGGGATTDDLTAVSAAGGDSLAERLAGFLSRLERWRTLARRQPLGDVIWQLYRETGYLEFAGGLPGGAQRQANLRALLDRARQFEGFARHGLFRFLRFIERLQQNEGDLGTARALGENEDVVRVMSIHRAKGLEFPVVIVADLGHAFNLRDLSADVLLHGRLGLAPLYFDTAAGVKYPTLPYLAAAHRLRLEALSEEARILYVALTRAREKLLLVGSARDLPRRAASWCAGLLHDGEQLPAMLMARAGSHLDWVAAALARHPQGTSLRRLAGVEGGFILADPSCWQVEVVQGEGGEAGLTGAAGLPLSLWRRPDRAAEDRCDITAPGSAAGMTATVTPFSGDELTGQMALGNATATAFAPASRSRGDELTGQVTAGAAAVTTPATVPAHVLSGPAGASAPPDRHPEGVSLPAVPAGGALSESATVRLQQEVTRRLSWVYPYNALTTLPVKIAATELKRRFDVFNEGEAPVQPGGEGAPEQFPPAPLAPGGGPPAGSRLAEAAVKTPFSSCPAEAAATSTSRQGDRGQNPAGVAAAGGKNAGLPAGSDWPGGMGGYVAAAGDSSAGHPGRLHQQVTGGGRDTGITAAVATVGCLREMGERAAMTPRGNFKGAFTRRPLFLQEQKGLTATEKGTATHLVLQHVDLTRPVTAGGLATLLQRLVDREVLTPEQAQAVDRGAILAFLAGPLGRRLLDRPERVRRELPFSLAIPIAELYPHLPAAVATAETAIVQGIIDCLVEEDEGFLLLDFKTGRVPPDPLVVYSAQVHMYSRAVETIFRRPVKETHLYFLDSGRNYRV